MLRGKKFWRVLPLLLVTLGVTLATRAEANDAQADPEIARLIEQLGSQEYVARQRAESELIRRGFEAFDALTAAENHPDLEVAARARYLARRIDISWAREEDPQDVKRIMSDYGDSNDENRLERVNRLVALSEGQGVDALCRIVRFEKSSLLAKQTAIALLESKPADPEFWTRHAKTIDKSLGGSARPAGNWLRSKLLAEREAAQALDDWAALVEAEQEVLESTPDESSTSIVLALMRQRVALLKQLDRRDEAVAAMVKMIDLEAGNAETLAELVDWLAQEKAWSVIDQVAQRFSAQFERDASLLYVLAEARVIQGDEKLAEEVAQRALRLNPELSTDHLRAAYELQKRGRFAWSEREYRYVIKLGPPASRTALMSGTWLTEMLHDQAQELEAAKVLQEIVDRMDKDDSVVQGVRRINREPESLRSRMDYFYAEHYTAQGDFAKAKEHLDKAIKHDSADADVLIAMHRLPKVSDEYRAKTRELIEAAAVEFESLVEEFPDDPTGYNQYAWLVGNSVGDIDKALRYSHRSLELKPDAAGYLDTLAHCYYTKGDYANAVRYQEQAVELDPHSGLLKRPLDKFRAAAEQQKAETPQPEKTPAGDAPAPK